MASNGHFSGRISTAIDTATSKSTGREGKFYEIFNKFGFYDIDDEKNGLTKEQRMQVPEINRKRFSQFSSAFSEMIQYYLGDAEVGVLSKEVQGIVDKMDARAASNAAQLNAIGSGLSAVPGGAAINASMKAMDAQTTSIMGFSPYDPDLIPPISIGMDGLPSGIANLYKAGFFQPNWDFIYSHETVKSNKLYSTGDGKLRIGANMLLDQGTDKNDQFLYSLFSVISVDENGMPIGDLKGGLTIEQFNTIKTFAKQTASILSSNPEAKNFVITDSQMQSAFYKYVTLKLWDVISNRKNWAYSHWGALTHNSMPEYVKTAVCSYVWTTGLAIGKDTEVSAFVSYCITMGLFYLVGYQYKVRIYGIQNVNKKLDKDNNVVDIPIGQDDTCLYGIPKDKNISNTYFTWAADIISRWTASSTLDEETSTSLRKRRIDEANLIYKGLGLPTIEYGTPLTNLPQEHSISALKERSFDKLIASTIYRYSNDGVAGGTGNAGSLQLPESVTANLDFSGVDATPVESSKDYIRSLMDKSGVKYAKVTCIVRDINDQIRVMFNNLQNNAIIPYKSSARNGQPATAGAAVVNAYYSEKKKLGYLQSIAVSASHASQIKDAMLTEAKKQGVTNISKHSGDYTLLHVIDISPKSIQPQSALPLFRQVLLSEKKNGHLRNFLEPDKDPALHIEIWTEKGNASLSPLPFNIGKNDSIPTVAFTFKNTVLDKEVGLMAALAKDSTLTTTKTS